MVSQWSLSDNKSSQVSRTLLSILADLNNAIVWTVSIRPVIYRSSNPCTNPLVTVSSAPVTIGTIVTFMYHSFFNSQARSRYLSLFSHPFNFTLWSPGMAKSIILQVLFFFVEKPDIGLMSRVITNGPGDLGSIPAWVTPNTKEMVFDASLLNIIRHWSRVKWSNPRKGLAPFLHLGVVAIERGSFRVTLDYDRKLYFFFIIRFGRQAEI